MPKCLRFLVLLVVFQSVVECIYSQNKEYVQADSTVRFLTYGFAGSDDWFEAQERVAKEWNIEFYPVAGCLVTDKLRDSVTKENESSNRILTNKYGANWRAQFNDIVRKEFECELNEKRTKSWNLTFLNQDFLSTLTTSKRGDFIALNYTIKENKKTKVNRQNLIPRIDSSVHTTQFNRLFLGMDNKLYITLPLEYELNALIIEASNARIAIDENYRSKEAIGLQQIRLMVLPTAIDSVQLTFKSGAYKEHFLFQTSYFPLVQLKINETVAQEVLSLENCSQLKLQCITPPEFGLKNKFEVLNWTIYYGASEFVNGIGEELPSEVLTLLKSLPSGTSLNILVSLKDGMSENMRRMNMECKLK